MAEPLDALYASDGVAPAVRATISSDRLPTDMDIITDTVLNWPHKGIATSGTPDDDGIIIPGTECVFAYVLSGTIIHITGFAPGYYDAGNEENQIVIIKPTTYHNDSLINAIENFSSIPDGGTTGQALIKASNADQDVEWGGGNSVSIISKEVPAGLVNGSNTTFTTALPYVAGSLQVYLNGLAQSNLITESNPLTGEFTVSPAPLTGDNINVAYQYAPSTTGNADTIDSFHASSTPTANTILPLDSSSLYPLSVFPDGMLVNHTFAGLNDSGTTSSVIPLDDTIPQNTEGVEILTATITPKQSTDLLAVRATVYIAAGGASGGATVALFRDSTANALTAGVSNNVNSSHHVITIDVQVVAGSTAATTFKLRAGSTSANAIRWNGSGGRYFGDIPKTSIEINEYKAS